jgi:hypothetical protein
MQAISLTPGEIVLGFRLRQCFPARLRDALPQDDDQFVRSVCKDEEVTTLDFAHARHWAVNQLNATSFEGTEAALMAGRIEVAFR